MPTNSEILNALGTGSNCLRTHKNLQPVKRPNGEYFFSTGNFSLVVKMHDPNNGKYYAVKCFTHIHPNLIESYALIGKHLQMNQSPYLVHYEFCENEIWVNSELDGNRGYPVIIMEWIEGKTLGSYLAELVSNADKEALFQLACNFDALSLWLLEQPFAHGDLKTDNILIDSFGRLRLIDYDGMFTPEMLNQLARENGSPGFRHPNRIPEYFNFSIDDFSILLISLSLHALATNPFIIGNNINFSDNILFTEENLNNPEHLTWHLIDILRENIQVAKRKVILQMAVSNPPRRLYLDPILNETACYTTILSNCEEIPDEDIEIYSEYKLDSNDIYFGFKQKSTGKVICNAIFDYNVKDFKEGLALVRSKKKYGFINKRGRIIIPTIYDNALSFSEGIALVGVDQKYGFINKSGKIIIPLIYDCNEICYECQKYNLDIYSEGLSGVKLNDKCGYIDKTGKVIIPFIYDDVEIFTNGLACIRFNEKWGFINKIGEIIVPFSFKGHWRYDKINDPLRFELGQYDYSDYCNNAFEFSFKEDLGALRVDGKFGFIDTSGNVIIPFIYEEAYNFSDGLARVKLNDKYGFIDKTGQEIISFKYDFAEDFSYGLAEVGVETNECIGSYGDHLIMERDYVYIDSTGKDFTFPNHNFSYFHEGIARVSLNNKKGYIDTNGHVIIPMIYDDAENFHNGIAKIELNNKQSFIDRTGNIIFPLIYDQIDKFTDELTCVQLNNHKGLIDELGNVVVPLIYEKIDGYSEGMIRVHINGKMGFINSLGQVIIPVIYDDAKVFSRGLALVKLIDKEGYIDKMGKVQWINNMPE